MAPQAVVEAGTSLPSVDELIAAGALFIANHSGGKDSQAMLIRLLERIPRQQLIVVHSSLGEVEWEGAMEIAQRQAEDAGLPFLLVQPTKSFFDLVEHRYAVNPGPGSSCWPSASIRLCTSSLKRDPIMRDVRRYAKQHGYTRLVSCMGLRAAESPGRAKRAPFTRNARGSTAGREWYEWLPIHDMSTEQVFQTITGAGQAPHPAYAAGNARLSCVLCIMASAKDIALGARARPELLAKYIEIEERTGYTMHQSRKSLQELIAIGEKQLGQMPTTAEKT